MLVFRKLPSQPQLERTPTAVGEKQVGFTFFSTDKEEQIMVTEASNLRPPATEYGTLATTLLSQESG